MNRRDTCCSCGKKLSREWLDAVRLKADATDDQAHYDRYEPFEPRVGERVSLYFGGEGVVRLVRDKRGNGWLNPTHQVWLGLYDRYRGVGDDEYPFCTLRCAARLGEACARRGYRLERKGS